MKRRARIDTRIAVLLVIILLNIGSIWSNSLQSIPESQAESQSVLEVIEPLYEVFVGEGNVTENLVRKTAHFAEYALLGLELMLLLAAAQNLSLQNAANCWSVSLLVAIVDETIQVYSHRGSQVTDVILDFLGALIGMLVTFAAISIVKHFRNRGALKS